VVDFINEPDLEPTYDRNRRIFHARVFEVGFRDGNSFGLKLEIDSELLCSLAHTGVSIGEPPIAWQPTQEAYDHINESFLTWLTDERLRWPDHAY
jgi:hypothetical protein